MGELSGLGVHHIQSVAERAHPEKAAFVNMEAGGVVIADAGKVVVEVLKTGKSLVVAIEKVQASLVGSDPKY